MPSENLRLKVHDPKLFEKMVSGDVLQTILPNLDISPYAVGSFIDLWCDKSGITETGKITRVERVTVRPTDMDLNGRQLHTFIVDREDPTPTGSEFAAACGFEDFMGMSDRIGGRHGLPFKGTVIYWTLDF